MSVIVVLRGGTVVELEEAVGVGDPRVGPVVPEDPLLACYDAENRHVAIFPINSVAGWYVPSPEAAEGASNKSLSILLVSGYELEMDEGTAYSREGGIIVLRTGEQFQQTVGQFWTRDIAMIRTKEPERRPLGFDLTP